MKEYDVIAVGLGPAATSAAIYAAMGGYRTLLIGEKSEDEMHAGVVMLAQTAADLVCEEEIDKVTLQVEKEMVAISMNQKGIVKVSRTSKRQQSLDG